MNTKEETNTTGSGDPETGEVPGVPKKHQLSIVSSQYDRGKKGHLTEGEQKARALDLENKGYLSGSQAAGLGQETSDLERQVKHLKRMIYLLAILVVVMAAGCIAASILAVQANKDSNVDQATGQLLTKDGKLPVTCEATGGTVELEFHQETNVGPLYSCIRGEQAQRLWDTMVHGTPNIIKGSMAEDDQGTNSDLSIKPLFTFALTSEKATFNETHMVVPTASGGEFVMDFTDPRCDDDVSRALAMQSLDSDVLETLQQVIGTDLWDHHALEQMDHHARRKLFYHMATRGKHHRELLDRLRYVEIKHGRISMLAVVGYLITG